MKKNIFLLILCINFATIFSQEKRQIENIIYNYPNKFKSVEEISNKLKSDFDNKLDLSYAAYFWIINNITYSTSPEINPKSILFSYKTEKEKIEKEKRTFALLASDALSKNNGVCHNYAALFNEICRDCGIESKLVIGNLKSSPDQIGAELDLNHAWNYLKITNNYIIIDCTLGATIKNSSVPQEFYFNTSPELFYLNHYPMETNQFSSIYSKPDYQKLPLFYECYYTSKFKLKTNLTGLFSYSKTNEINLQFENVNDNLDYFSCYFQNSNSKIELNKENDSNSFRIKLNNPEDFITIYANYKALMTLKIVN
jgi:transglutaminase/protease-like cytokinesis protein 3